ncbi:MAG: hypothetical protein PHQ80_03350 [Candidatus ainarchaeum sp.]|nr:hypothetical protein [Candidatus ainarchaeum sp.]
MSEIRQLQQKYAAPRIRFREWRYRTYERIGLLRDIRTEQEAMKTGRASLTQLDDKELLQRGILVLEKSQSLCARETPLKVGLALGSAGILWMAIDIFTNSANKWLGGVFAAVSVGLVFAADIINRRGRVRETMFSEEFSNVLREQIRRKPFGWEQQVDKRVAH